jgi:transcriptional regulator with XRE-family HTH domain
MRLGLRIEIEVLMFSLKVPQQEGTDSILAKNLVVARLIARVTQHDLAAASDVSRATIAQLEAGYSDPRLSTITDLARALGISPIVLLIGTAEAQALVGLLQQVQTQQLSLPPEKLALMRQHVQSGMLKDRLRAGRIGAELSGETGAAAVVAAILTAIIPGEGTVIGAALGNLLAVPRT